MNSVTLSKNQPATRNVYISGTGTVSFQAVGTGRAFDADTDSCSLPDFVIPLVILPTTHATAAITFGSWSDLKKVFVPITTKLTTANDIITMTYSASDGVAALAAPMCRARTTFA